ncbi:MAG: MBL fold metallo-hydrolase [Bacteroidia bacterium]|nr:MBL fold metallo-hydrolase [Bacteroidia bacterium]
MHKKFTYCLSLFLLPFIFGACSKSVNRLFNRGNVKGVRSPAISSAVHKTSDYKLKFDSGKNKQLYLRYLGCGGYYIGTDKNALLIDPYFSNKSFLFVPISKMHTKINNVKYGLKDLPIHDRVRAVFVSHSHYDHMLDVPYIYTHFTDTATTKIICSQSGVNMLANLKNINKQHIVNIDSTGFSDFTQLSTQYSLGSDKSIVVTPIRSDHAPHYKKIAFYKGSSHPVKKYKEESQSTCANQWKLGTPFAFLIDIKGEDGKIEFRIFIMSSAAQPKFGWLPPELKSQHPVNLAILGAASFEYVSNYPEGIIDHLNPEKIIICHWEDFFNSYMKKNKRTVRFTNIKKFLYRLNSVYPYNVNGHEQFSMPDPKVNITINY